MFDGITKLWDKYGFNTLVVLSILFFVICWIFGWKKDKGGKKIGFKQLVNEYANLQMPKNSVVKRRDPKKTENRCREIIEAIFSKPFPSERPDFLQNPDTGKNLECDMMNQHLKLCVEYNGAQHYKQVDHFHKKEDALAQQKRRDIIKKTLLAKNGFTLIEIPYTVHYDVLEQYICETLSKNPLYKPYVDKYVSA